MIQLMTQLQNAPNNPQARSEHATRNIPPCPGLKRVTGSEYKWTVPYGSSPAEATFCERCTESLNIIGTVYKSNGGCNCDSFLKENDADNGIFNISFWDLNQMKFFKTSAVESACNTYYVPIPSGKCFNILINSLNKKNQTFRYEIMATNGGSEKSYVFLSETSTHIIGSSYVSRGAKKIGFTYIDSNNPGWDLLDSDNRILVHNVVKPGDTLTIKMHIYNVVAHDFMKDSGNNIGNYKLHQNTIITKGNNHPKQQHDYDSTEYSTLSRYDHILFTKKPVEMKFVFITDGIDSVETDILLKKTLKKMLTRASSKLASIRSNAQIISNNYSKVSEQRDTLVANMKDAMISMGDIKKCLETIEAEPMLKGKIN